MAYFEKNVKDIVTEKEIHYRSDECKIITWRVSSCGSVSGCNLSIEFEDINGKKKIRFEGKELLRLMAEVSFHVRESYNENSIDIAIFLRHFKGSA